MHEVHPTLTNICQLRLHNFYTHLYQISKYYHTLHRTPHPISRILSTQKITTANPDLGQSLIDMRFKQDYCLLVQNNPPKDNTIDSNILWSIKLMRTTDNPFTVLAHSTRTCMDFDFVWCVCICPSSKDVANGNITSFITYNASGNKRSTIVFPASVPYPTICLKSSTSFSRNRSDQIR